MAKREGESLRIFTTPLYEKQLRDILDKLSKQNMQETKKFKSYLDAIIVNIETKYKKYKKSLYFDNENIKEIDFQGCKIVFFMDKNNNSYVILGITAKN